MKDRDPDAAMGWRATAWWPVGMLLAVLLVTAVLARSSHPGVGLAGAALLGWMGIEWLLGERVGTRPALLIGVLLIVVSVQMISLGLLGELMVNLRRRRSLDATAVGDLL